jgi:GGDEF domain-containing protein
MTINVDQQRPEKRFATPFELQFLKTVNDLEKAATTDKLTGLSNANYWREQLPKLEKSSHLAFIIISLDLDNLKPVNDEHGHQAGDLLLRQTAAIIQNSFRPEDISARIGGDEFAVILPYDPEKLQDEFQKHRQTDDKPPINLQNYIENLVTTRLVDNLTSFNATHPDSPPVSFSFGSHLSLPDKHKIPPHNLTDTFRQADQKMYQMKQKHHQELTHQS